ncbi:class II aldolase/adducin family protein [bacterium]|nr:class II aldolase/adducin family protein [bacterium]
MLESLKKEIIEYGMLAGEKNFTPGISGNISAKCENQVIITASGSANGYLSEGDFSVIDFDGNVVTGNEKPSTEKFLHIEYYKQRPDINCVFHTHSPYLTAYASAGIPLDMNVSPEIIYCFGKIPVAEYALPGSVELVENTSKYFKEYDVILMKNHGVIIAGQNVKDAYLKLELVEAYAKTNICAKILGGAKILEENEVRKIYELRNK